MVILANSEVTFLREREDAAFCPSVYCILIIYGLTLLEQYVVKFLYIPYIYIYILAGSQGVIVIVVRNGHGDQSSNPEQDCF